MIELNRTQMIFPPSGGTKTVDVTVGSGDWWGATWSGDEMISITPENAGGSATVTVNCLYNQESYTQYNTATFTNWDDVPTTSTQLSIILVNNVIPVSLSATAGYFPSSTETEGITLVSNIEWTASASDSWISVPTSGISTSTVQITVDANSSTAGRTGTVIFTDDVGNIATYTIDQVGYTDPITISPTGYTFPAAGATISLAVDYDYDWRVVRSDSNIVSLDKYSGVGDDTITVTVQPNSGNQRTFTLTFTDGDYNQVVFTGIQSATDTPTITLDPVTSSLGPTTQMAQFVITTAGSVGPLTATFSGDVVITNYTINGNLLNVYTADNTGALDLTTTVTVTDGNVSGTATLIKRGQTSYLEVIPTGKTVSYEAGSTTFVVSTNLSNITTSISGAMVITSATVNNNILTVVYGANTGQNNKYSTILLSADDGSGNTYTATVSMMQEYNASVPYLSINPQSKTVAATSGMTTFSVSSESLTNITIKSASGSMDVTNCTYNNNQISVSYNQNSALYQKGYTIVLSGLDPNLQEVTATATITQAAATAAYVFQFNPASQSTKTVSASSQTLNYTITSTLNSSPVGYSISSNTGWITINNNSVLVAVNNNSSSRTGTVTFTQSGSGNTLTATITQNGQSIVSATNPIWNDYTVSSTSDFLEYHIYNNGELIYGGKAYAYPNSNIQFTVNDVCSNYLGNGILFQAGVHQIPDYAKTFTIQTTDGVSYNVGFYNSWAYENSNFLSEPIYTRLDPRQWLPVSVLTGSVTINGTTYSGSNGYTVMTSLANYLCGSNIVVTSNGKTYVYTVCEGDYALYYANRFGGWDTLLCNSASRKTDNINRFSYKKITGEKRNYQTNVTPTWNLKTFPMFQNEGEKMFNLLESNYVYLHNLKTNEIVPVIIKNSNCDYLNNYNNKRPYTYDIQVEEAFNKFRK